MENEYIMDEYNNMEKYNNLDPLNDWKKLKLIEEDNINGNFYASTIVNWGSW